MRFFEIAFRPNDDLYDADTLDQRLESIDDGIGKLEQDIDGIHDDVQMLIYHRNVVTGMLRWTLFLLVLALVVAGIGFGVALSVVWG